uniref:Uncharacterized protein n=1 Tax=Cacopsylla melanoneura TaxID=428564 RepID=A0A8D8ZAG6_9HEMI
MLNNRVGECPCCVFYRIKMRNIESEILGLLLSVPTILLGRFMRRLPIRLIIINFSLSVTDTTICYHSGCGSGNPLCYIRHPLCYIRYAISDVYNRIIFHSTLSPSDYTQGMPKLFPAGIRTRALWITSPTL